MIYRVETFPHYQRDSIITWVRGEESLMGLQPGINVVELEPNKPSYINVRHATEEEVEWLYVTDREFGITIDEGTIYFS